MWPLNPLGWPPWRIGCPEGTAEDRIPGVGGHSIGFTINIHLTDPGGGGGTSGGSVPLREEPHKGIGFEFEYLSEFELIFETALDYDSWGPGMCFYGKKTVYKKSHDIVPVRYTGSGVGMRPN